MPNARQRNPSAETVPVSTGPIRGGSLFGSQLSVHLLSVRWPDSPTVLYTRGAGCAELAELLSPDANRVAGDLADACATARADLLVTRKLPAGFDLVSLAVPFDFKPEGIGAVVAAVAGGPHSELNASLGTALGKRLNVETLIATAYFSEEGRVEAEETVERILFQHSDLPRLAVGAADAAGFIRELPDRSLLILGEPGGSFLSRSFFGPGARLKAKAPVGVVMVRYAPPRVFHVMGDPVFVSPLHHAGDTLKLHRQSLMAVAENGRLVGVVRRGALEAAAQESTVSDLMEEPVAVRWDDSLEDAGKQLVGIDGTPIPVTDPAGRLVGALQRSEL
jgi:CBS domain-containing protein